MQFSPLPSIRRYLRNKLDELVASGPYKGMKFPENNGIDCYECKLMGIYEKELHPVIENLTQKKLHSLTIIGAAEGYHATGLARSTSLIPTCFESDRIRSKNLMEMGNFNEIEVDIRGSFGKDTIWNAKPGLIFIDIEGNEMGVLTEERLEMWQKHYLIVEVHSEEILQSLKERSHGLFKIEWIKCKKRTIHDYPFSIPLKHALRRWWNVPVQEWRSDSLGWLVLSPLKG